MNEVFKINQILKIIPEDVNSSFSAKILKLDKDFIFAASNTKQIDINEICECFCITESGIAYFKTNIESINEEYRLVFPENITLLQRREYSRVNYNNKITLDCDNKKISVLVTDISAGGMKILSEQRLEIKKIYTGTRCLGKNTEITIQYLLIRQEKNKDGLFEISGKFYNLPHKDKISLIQYCFSRQMETTNK